MKDDPYSHDIPKVLGPLKKIQIKKAEDHENTIDFGGRHWAIKL